MIPTILDRTSATVSHGDTAQELPATILTTEDAAMLGEYASWLSRERLSAKLFCADCGTDKEVEVFIDPTKIGIICAHRLLYYEGQVPVCETVHPDAGVSISVIRTIIPEKVMAIADAYLVRRYQKFLRTHGFKEALWCLKCEDEGNSSGLRAYVQPAEMAFLCRCASRVHKGLTI